MRKCTVCKVKKEESEFYVQWRNNRGRYYPQRHCKDCDKELCKVHYLKNKEKIKASSKKWNTENRERVNKRHYEYYQKNKQKCYARGVVNYSLRVGKIQKPSVCTMCGLEKKLHAHHVDYSLPLEIKWLCIDCHIKEHKEEKSGNNI